MNSASSTMDDNPHPLSQQTPFAGDENQHQPMAGIQNAIIGNTTNPGPSPGTHFPMSGSVPQNPNPFPIYMATGHPGQSHPAQGSYPSSAGGGICGMQVPFFQGSMKTDQCPEGIDISLPLHPPLQLHKVSESRMCSVRQAEYDVIGSRSRGTLRTSNFLS